MEGGGWVTSLEERRPGGTDAGDTERLENATFVLQ